MKKTDVRKALDKVYKQMEKDNWDMKSVSTYRRELMTELALVPPQASELPLKPSLCPDCEGEGRIVRGRTKDAIIIECEKCKGKGSL